MSLDTDKSVVVVGGGLVGCLQAIYMAERGYRVKLFEKHGDIRLETKGKGRSRNLTLGYRGLCALERVGLARAIKEMGVPTYGRLVHRIDGSQFVDPYGEEKGKKLCFYSLDRHGFNCALLSHAENARNIKIYFNHRLSACNFETKRATFLSKDGETTVQNFYFLCGCDGAKSIVRQELCQHTELNFSQTFVKHKYVEVGMPYRSDRPVQESNYIHVWPRNQILLVGLENPDKSFTGTLIMPLSTFKELDTKEKALSYFNKQFADVKKLFGDDLVMPKYPWKPLPMVSIKCDPLHYKDSCVLMGDAAHAMVPFYGQGMNSALEDCLVFTDALDKYEPNMERVFTEYTRTRLADAHAMVDLSMLHYAELSANVVTYRYRLLSAIDRVFTRIFPSSWIEVKRAVNFSRLRYSRCLERKLWQEKVSNRLINIGLVSGAAFTLYVVVRLCGWNLTDKLTDSISNHIIQTQILQPLQKFRNQPQFNVRNLSTK